MTKRWKKCCECKRELFLKKHWWHDLRKVICGECFFPEEMQKGGEQ